MRPIQLVMQAFGPYSKRETIDFGKIGKSSLFLITGPTGSGKTTIFDAICFALYGETSGNVRAPEQLRSQFADSGMMTEVELVFELKKSVYHIHRIPKQPKPKTRGDGFTEQKSEATLIVDTKGERKVYTGVMSVNEMVETIIGINAEQFRQIMMIPQGEFQRLLIADSQEREKVLRKLFDTHMYRLFQLNIDERSKNLYGQVKTMQQLREHELKRIECDKESRLYEYLQQKPLGIATIIQTTQQVIQEDKENIHADHQSIQNIDKTIEQTIQKREHANKVNEKLLQLERVSKQWEDLDKQQEAIRLLEGDLQQGKKAAGIEPLKNHWEQRKDEVKTLEQMRENLADQKKQVDKTFSGIENALKELQSDQRKEKTEHLKQEQRQLQEYKERIDQYHKVKNEVSASEQALVQLERQKKESEAIYSKNKESIKTLNIEKDNGAKAKLKLLERKEVLLETRTYTKGYSKAKKWLLLKVEAKEAYTKVSEQFSQVTKNMKHAQHTYKKIRMEFMLNQAALLARELEEGMPCPVCGSTEHPNMVMATTNLVTQEQLNSAEQVYEKLRGQCQELEKTCTTKKEQLKQWQEKLQALFEEELQTQMMELNQVEHELICLGKKQKQLEAECEVQEKVIEQSALHEEKIQEIEQSQVQLEEKLERIQQQWIEAGQIYTERKTIFNGICEQLPQEYRDKAKLNKALESVTGRIEKQEQQLRTCLESYEQTKEELNRLQTTIVEHEKRFMAACSYQDKTYEELLEALNTQGFATLDALQEAKLSAQEMEQMQHQLDSYIQQKHALHVQKNNLEEEMKGIKNIDLAVFEERLTELKAQRDKVNQHLSQKKYRYEHNQKIIDGVLELQAQMETQEAQYAVLGDLAQVAQGNNPLRISFERYVLAAFLEDVLIAANTRLAKMTFGRYVLYRSDDLERKNRQSGLELQVFDNYTGKMRHVKTLSGGESFKTSLAMALGLSDVVQSYSGGIQLDTMFVDEGFGTLDQESLDSAINCLIDLQKSGRLIGIISHVQELKERIEHRLEIYASQTGSHAEFV